MAEGETRTATQSTILRWSKAILLLALIAAALLPLGPLGAKAGIWGFQVGLLSLVVAMGLAALGVIIGVVALLVARKRHLPASRRPIYLAMVVNVVVLIVMGSQFIGGGRAPPIHNISTDVTDPPKFDKVVALRGTQSNPLEIDAETIEMQAESYPWLQPLAVPASVADTFAVAVLALEDMGLELVNADPDKRLVEATATTFWFGFKDDVAIRISPTNDGSLVDVRSVSRVGLGDLGTNAERISEILERIEAGAGSP
tara:strand:+ start:2524 stop:3294 length:771 start_codon:yes stop_codon:yes gene_type:complete